MKGGGDMSALGYYEIINYRIYQADLKARVIAGNIRFNRMHWHDSLEILCCIYGSCKINIQGQIFNLQGGDLVTINPGLGHEISSSKEKGLQLVFSVDPSVFYQREGRKKVYDFATVGGGSLDKNHKDVCKIRSSIARMCCILMPDDEVVNKLKEGKENLTHISKKDFKESDIGQPLKTEQRWYEFHVELYQILASLAKYKSSNELTTPTKTPMSHFNRCVELIHEQYDQPLSTKVIAKEIGFSESTIYRLFQDYMGMSFVSYLNLVRISAACGLIEDGSLSIIEIAGRCGFSSLSNFYRAFHQFVGLSPRKYSQLKGINNQSIKGMQKDIMLLNRFQPYWDLPYTKEDLWNIQYM